MVGVFSFPDEDLAGVLGLPVREVDLGRNGLFIAFIEVDLDGVFDRPPNLFSESFDEVLDGVLGLPSDLGCCSTFCSAAASVKFRDDLPLLLAAAFSIFV